MSFADPTTLAFTSPGNVAMARVSTSENRSSYVSADQTVNMTISHAYAKRNRRVIRVDLTKTGANPLYPDQNQVFSTAAYVVLDQPKVGFTAAELKDLVVTLCTYLTATTGANAVKWIQGEN